MRWEIGEFVVLFLKCLFILLFFGIVLPMLMEKILSILIDNNLNYKNSMFVNKLFMHKFHYNMTLFIKWI